MRMSATDLDAWRYWRDNEDAELDSLLAQLRRESPPSEPMLAGSALHKALELATPGDYSALQADGYTFLLDFDAELALPPIREIKATRDYVIAGVPVTLVGVADLLEGRRVEDHKFTGRFDPERFLSSFQWRVYLEVFDADTFRWNVFEGRETGPKSYTIHSLHLLGCHRYPGLADDLERELFGFVDFAQNFLPERFEVAEAA